MSINITNQQNILGQASGYGTESAQRDPKTQLGQKDFLQLLTVQLQNQDPLSPMSDMDFIASMSSFSSVEAMGSLSGNFEKFMKEQSSLNQSMLTTLTNLSGVLGATQEVQKQLMAQAYLGKEVTITDPDKGVFSGVVERVELIDKLKADGTVEPVVGLVVNGEIFPVDLVTAIHGEGQGFLATMGNVLNSVVGGAGSLF
jgi:flagellar hook assembly protein FlgD